MKTEMQINTLKILSIIMIILSSLYINVFGFVIASLTFYGLQKKSIKVLKFSMIPNGFLTLVYSLSFIACVIVSISESFNILLLVVVTSQSIIQLYLTCILFYLISNPFVFTDISLYDLFDSIIIENEISESNIIQEIETLPPYTPEDINKLPPYSNTNTNTNTNTVTDDETINNNLAQLSTENISIIIDNNQNLNNESQ